MMIMLAWLFTNKNCPIEILHKLSKYRRSKNHSFIRKNYTIEFFYRRKIFTGYKRAIKSAFLKPKLSFFISMMNGEKLVYHLRRVVHRSIKLKYEEVEDSRKIDF